MQVKFQRQTITLKLGRYQSKDKFYINKVEEVSGYVYGSDPLFGYCRTVAGEPGEEDTPWSVIHVKTGFTMFYCGSEKRCRLVIKEIEAHYRYIFEFDTVPKAAYFKPHKPAIVYLRTLAQGGEVD